MSWHCALSCSFFRERVGALVDELGRRQDGFGGLRGAAHYGVELVGDAPHLRPFESRDVQRGDLVLGLVDRLVDDIELGLELLRLRELGLVGLDHLLRNCLARRNDVAQRLQLGHDLGMLRRAVRDDSRHPMAVD